MDRTGGEDYRPLAMVLVQVVHEKDAKAPHALCAKLHSERGMFHI
jgi:hypothetical protein